MNYHHLRLFHAIAQEGSLTRAAARLRLSQSAVSTQVQKLERQLGHALFERQGRRLVLTEAGRIALDYAETVFRAGDELLGTLRQRPRSEGTVLRVGALTTLSRNFQMNFLRPLLGRPGLELVLRSGTTRELLAALEGHTLDLVLANSALWRDSHAALDSFLLDRQPVSLVGRPTARRFRFPDDLRHHPVLLPSRESDIRQAFDQVMAMAAIRPLVAAEIDDMAMLRLMARESEALALVPPIVVQDELREGVLVERSRIADVFENFYAIVRPRRFPHPLLGELLPRG